jgi:Fe-S-cluster containining protein
MQVEKLAKKARRSISRFCIDECKSYCCRKGHLSLMDYEVDLIVGDKKIQLVTEGHLKQYQNKSHLLSLEYNKIGCPRLKNYRCTIHKDPNRPKVCQEYPLFISEMTIRLSSRCLAVRMNLFYPYVKQFMRLGYKVIESVDFNDSDTYPPPGIRKMALKNTDNFLST